MITFTQLREQLGITQRALSNLIRDGLPCLAEGRRKVFEEEDVARWLLANNRAVLKEEEATKESPRVARTRKECAEHFHVHLRTVADWLEEPGFPGRAGTRGRRDGHFPLDEIAAWIETRDALRNGGPRLDTPGLRDEMLSIKIQRERHRLAEEEGRLARIEDMVELVERLTNTAKRLLESLPDEAAKDLPEDLPAHTKTAVIKRLRRRIFDIERVVSEAIAGDTDDTEDT